MGIIVNDGSRMITDDSITDKDVAEYHRLVLEIFKVSKRLLNRKSIGTDSYLLVESKYNDFNSTIYSDEDFTGDKWQYSVRILMSKKDRK